MKYDWPVQENSPQNSRPVRNLGPQPVGSKKNRAAARGNHAVFEKSSPGYFINNIWRARLMAVVRRR